MFGRFWSLGARTTSQPSPSGPPTVHFVHIPTGGGFKYNRQEVFPPPSFTIERFPTSDEEIEWTPTEGSNYENVQLPAPTVPTKYNYATDNDQEDWFGIAPINVPEGATRISVSLHFNGYGTESHYAYGLLWIGEATYWGATNFPWYSAWGMSEGRSEYVTTWDTNPATGLPWTVEEVNNLTRIGYRSQFSPGVLCIAGFFLRVIYIFGDCGEPKEWVNFNHSSCGTEVDNISDAVHITRGAIRSIYNKVLETRYNSGSPLDTEWESSLGWNNLTDLKIRTYRNFYDSLGGDIGESVVGREMIMRIISEDRYFKVQFVCWVSGRDPVSVPADEISNTLHIQRSITESIYNDVYETEAQSGNYRSSLSPADTEWNSEDGWSDLSNVSTRTYQNFVRTLNYQVGNNVVGAELVMRIMSQQRYFKIKFTSWTSDPGSFIYDRQEITDIGTPIGDPVHFEHSVHGSEVDEITSAVHITRGELQPIYNTVLESHYTYGSPVNTEWNLDGWSDLSDIRTRTYQDFYNVLNEEIGNYVIDAELVMRLVSEDRYFKVKFSAWQKLGGGGFTYDRQEILV